MKINRHQFNVSKGNVPLLLLHRHSDVPRYVLSVTIDLLLGQFVCPVCTYACSDVPRYVFVSDLLLRQL